MRSPSHPAREDIQLDAVFHALSDPTRLRIMGDLANGRPFPPTGRSERPIPGALRRYPHQPHQVRRHVRSCCPIDLECGRWLLAHPRFRLHFTPTSASWLNLVERWFAGLTQKKLKRGVHRSVQALERDIRAWLTDWNEHPRPFVWTKTADEILDKVAAYCRRISDSDH